MATDDELEERVAWLEAAVQHLSKYSVPPVTLPPKPGVNPTSLSPAAQEIARTGNTMGAVQQHRLDTGSSLAEAKAAVDSFGG